jgi:hypothetical protein
VAKSATTAALKATAWGQIWGQIGDDGDRIYGLDHLSTRGSSLHSPPSPTLPQAGDENELPPVMSTRKPPRNSAPRFAAADPRCCRHRRRRSPRCGVPRPRPTSGRCVLRTSLDSGLRDVGAATEYIGHCLVVPDLNGTDEFARPISHISEYKSGERRGLPRQARSCRRLRQLRHVGLPRPLHGVRVGAELMRQHSANCLPASPCRRRRSSWSAGSAKCGLASMSQSTNEEPLGF